MKTKVSAAAVLGWLGFALACTPNQPLPPPSNPASAVKACPDTACSAGQVCNRAIAGGTCTAPCTTDAGCGAIEPGLVCHAEASGGVCAPDCSTTIAGMTGDKICQALDASLACNSAGRCVPAVATTGDAHVRFFLAASDTPSVTIKANTLPLPIALLVAAGEASAYIDVAAGTYNFSYDFGAPFTPALEQSITVSADTHYTVPIFDRDAGTFDTQWFTDEPVYTPPGSAALRYFQACRGLPAQAVLFDSGAGAQPIVGGVSALLPQTVVDIPAKAGVFEVGTSPGAAAEMVGALTLAPGLLYTAITWCRQSLEVPETTVLSPAEPATPDPAEPLGDFQASGYRLLNASDLPQVVLTLDDQDGTAATTAGFATLDPSTRFKLISPGVHTLRLYRDFSSSGASNQIDSQPQTFAAGSVYSIVVGGQASIASPDLTVDVLSETVPSGVGPTQAVARLLDFAAADTTDLASLFLGDATGTPLGTASYLGVGSDVVFNLPTPATTPVSFTLTLGSAGPITTPALVLTPGAYYTAIATGTAVSGATNPILLWVVGPNAPVANVSGGAPNP